MQKLLWLILAVFVIVPAFAEINMPTAPSYTTSATNVKPAQSYKKEIPQSYSYPNKVNPAHKPVQPTTVKRSNGPTYEVKNTNGNIMIKKTGKDLPYSPETKAKLDSLAMSALRAAEKHNNTEMQNYMIEIMTNGADGISNPNIISKATPHCPPIKIQVNGRQLSGSTCAIMGYSYKGKSSIN